MSEHEYVTLADAAASAVAWAKRAEKAYESRIQWGQDENAVVAARIAQAWAQIAQVLK